MKIKNIRQQLSQYFLRFIVQDHLIIPILHLNKGKRDQTLLMMQKAIHLLTTDNLLKKARFNIKCWGKKTIVSHFKSF